ncbi:hypothetical protein PTKIN_Ptkin04bG0005500 [Pterospermum kingtungense]
MHFRIWRTAYEKHKRFENFKKSAFSVNRLNKESKSTHFALNLFADLDKSEIPYGYTPNRNLHLYRRQKGEEGVDMDGFENPRGY